MAVTIKVNGKLTLSHKGSGGWVKCTLPDVCKTPSPGGPVPVPYPTIFSFSKDLKDGTKTVKADGGNSCSISGSQYSVACGDEPGTAGGVKSGVNMKEATWLTYSFDVKMEGQGVCRLSDKMLMNHGNTASLAGDMETRLTPWEEIFLCEIFCACLRMGISNKWERPLPDLTAIEEPDFDPYQKPDAFGYQRCVEAELKAANNPTIIPEQTYNMKTTPPSPVSVRRGTPGTRRPDVVVLNGPGPAGEANLRSVVEMKFPGDSWRPGQEKAYKRIAKENNPDAPLEELTKERCCKKPEPEPVPVPVPVPERKKSWWEEVDWGKVGVVAVVGLAAVALTVVSGGSMAPAAVGIIAVAVIGPSAAPQSEFQY